MKNLFLILLLAIVIGVAGWYFNSAREDLLPVNLGLPENLPINSGIEESIAEKVVVKQENLPASDGEEVLKTRAAEIISRPITISAPLLETDRKQAKEKIKEMIDLIKIDYDNIYAWYDLGAYRRVIGDFEGAAEAWTFGALIRPKDFVSYHNLGDLYGFYMKDYPKSEKNYLKSIQNNPQNIQAYLDLATIYESVYKEKTDQVENILLQGLQANPGNANLQAALDNYRSSR